MGNHHLISINEDQLRVWQGDHDKLLANVGAAVVLTCLDPSSSGVAISETLSGTAGRPENSSVTVRHIGQHEGGDFAVWAWSAGDTVCMADLEEEDLDALGRLVEAVRQDKARVAGQ